MEFRTLGPIELWLAGRPHILGPEKERCLLAILLLTPGVVVPTESLIDRLWDADPPPKAQEGIATYISRLRNRLRPVLGNRVSLAGRDQGYAIKLDGVSVDLHEFRQRCRQATAAAGAGRRDEAVQLLREAEACWSGQALAGLRGDWAGRMRISLEEERRAAILERIKLEVGLGRHADLLAELRRLRDTYHLDEAFVAQEMTALHLSGRRSDALALYRETRQQLISESGMEPGPDLSVLHQRILESDTGLSRQRAEQVQAAAARVDTLPPDLEDFVGRREERELLGQQLTGEHGIKIIEGMAGVGKTALALRVARDAAGNYPGGSLYLNLHSHDQGHEPLSPADALYRLLQMIAIRPASIPREIETRIMLWSAELSRRRLIVILDDVATAEQIRPVLPRTSESLILVTTRRRLRGVPGAQRLELEVLPTGDAVRLFSQVSGLNPAPDAGEVAEVARLCGYLPLAIRLVAGRIRQAPAPALGDLIRELAGSLPAPEECVLSCGQLTSAFELSYRALAPGQQLLLRWLGAQPCTTISLHAAAALAGQDLASTQVALTGLLDYHLLEPATASRFRFHDLVRDYAGTLAERDDPEPELRKAMGRLLRYFLHTADKADRVLHPYRRRRPVPAGPAPAAVPPIETEEQARQWLESEWRNILQAARYAAVHEWKSRCVDLTHVLVGFLDSEAYWDEAITALTIAVQASKDLDDPERLAQSLVEFSLVSQQLGLHVKTLPLAEEAVGLYRSLGDQGGEAEALNRLGMAYLYSSRYREALAHFRESNTLYCEMGDRYGEATTLDHVGHACWYLGRRRDAAANFEAALAIYRKLGDRRNEAKVLNNMGDLKLYLRYHRDALRYYQDSQRIFVSIGGRWNLAILYSNIGSVYRFKGRYKEALAEYRRALALFQDIGDLRHQAGSLNDIGTAYQGLDDYSEALNYHEQSRMMAEQMGHSHALAIARRGIADVYRRSGRHAEAQGEYLAAIGLAREIDDPEEEAKSLEGMAETLLHTKGAKEARIKLLEALEIFEQMGSPEAESVQTRIDALDLIYRSPGT